VKLSAHQREYRIVCLFFSLAPFAAFLPNFCANHVQNFVREVVQVFHRFAEFKKTRETEIKFERSCRSRKLKVIFVTSQNLSAMDRDIGAHLDLLPDDVLGELILRPYLEIKDGKNRARFEQIMSISRRFRKLAHDCIRTMAIADRREYEELSAMLARFPNLKQVEKHDSRVKPSEYFRLEPKLIEFFRGLKERGISTRWDVSFDVQHNTTMRFDAIQIDELAVDLCTFGDTLEIKGLPETLKALKFKSREIFVGENTDFVDEHADFEGSELQELDFVKQKSADCGRNIVPINLYPRLRRIRGNGSQNYVARLLGLNRNVQELTLDEVGYAKPGETDARGLEFLSAGGRMRSIKKLNIKINTPYRRSTPFFEFNDSTFPCLETLEMYGELLGIGVAHTKLTELVFRAACGDDWRMLDSKLLLCAPNLEILECEDADVALHRPNCIAPEDEIVLPRLKRLACTMRCYDTFRGHIPRFTEAIVRHIEARDAGDSSDIAYDWDGISFRDRSSSFSVKISSSLTRERYLILCATEQLTIVAPRQEYAKFVVGDIIPLRSLTIRDERKVDIEDSDPLMRFHRGIDLSRIGDLSLLTNLRWDINMEIPQDFLRQIATSLVHLSLYGESYDSELFAELIFPQLDSLQLIAFGYKANQKYLFNCPRLTSFDCLQLNRAPGRQFIFRNRDQSLGPLLVDKMWDCNKESETKIIEL
jgi:hypothetical protein